MKKIVLKSIVTIAAAFLIFNCSDPASSDGAPNYLVSNPSLLYDEGETDLIIDQVTGNVTNANGEVVGKADFNTGVIIALDGVTIIAQNVVFAELEHITPPVVYSDAWILSADEVYVIYKSDYKVTDANGNAIGNFIPTIDPLTNQPTWVGSIIGSTGETILESVNLTTLKEFHATASSASTPIPASSSNVVPPPASSADVPPPVSSAIDNQSSDSQDPSVSSSSLTTQSSSSTISSSSNAPSSSSQAQSSSSAGSDNSKCPNITVRGGYSGTGWATRYWDCCSPHCSWPEHAHGTPAKTCDNKGKNPVGGGGSICSGGYQTTCTSQIPFTIDGCSDMGFAFAAVPASNGGDCGKCFQLTFTGTGKYHGKQDGTTGDKNHQAIKGKKLIIMVTNIGGDVNQGQFDIMIPGGGFGQFNGCSQMGWNMNDSKYNNEYKYGGLLSECEKESKYNEAKTLKCLKSKCETAFGSDTEAQEGCMFLAGFMHAAGNPMHEYTEVECPDVLKQRY